MAPHPRRTRLLITLVVTLLGHAANADRGCAARPVAGQSAVCVCNATYCDELVAEAPPEGGFIAYTSSEGGSRFRKSYGTFQAYRPTASGCRTVLELNPNKRHQRIEGFGGAVTDSTGINIKSLPPQMQKSLIDSYFSARGLEYNMMRVPIGGSDFSTHLYHYNELPVDDKQLSNFTLTREDFQYKIPVIKEAMRVATAPVHIVASTWSPPDWMKSSFPGKIRLNRLKDEYLQTYALYHLKFIEEYAKNGIGIWAVTTTNEPLDGVLPFGKFQHLGWSTKKMGKWIVNNLGPTLRNSSFSDVKILAVDDQRFAIPIWFNILVSTNSAVLQYVDGVAVHYYFDRLTPASLLREALSPHPGKFVLATEACAGFDAPKDKKVILGSWQRAQLYISDILEDLLNNVVGWIDWNMCLDMQGGPNWVENYVDSPIIVNAAKREFYKQPMYYAMGHVAKFVKRDSYRIELVNATECAKPPAGGACDDFDTTNIQENSDSQLPSYASAAFLTPDGDIVVVVHNEGAATSVALRVGEQQAELQLEAASITTVQFSYDGPLLYLDCCN